MWTLIKALISAVGYSNGALKGDSIPTKAAAAGKTSGEHTAYFSGFLPRLAVWCVDPVIKALYYETNTGNRE